MNELRVLVRLRCEELLRGDIADPIFTFVKPEPHKTSKIAEGRLRLISAVSLVDAMVDRVLFGWLANACLKNVGRTPCFVGWTPAKGGWRVIPAMFRRGRNLCLDKSAWDWTVPGWLVSMWLSLIKHLALDPPQWWISMAEARFRLLFEKPLYRFQDGFEIRQSGIGVMKSGCFLTILLNSVSQVLLHVLAAIQLGFDVRKALPATLGDDTVQDVTDFDVDAYVDVLRQFGVKIKSVDVRSDVEFAGFQYTSDKCVPAYNKKHLYKLEFAQHLDQTLEAMQMLYAHDPQYYTFYREVAKKTAPSVAMHLRRARSLLD